MFVLVLGMHRSGTSCLTGCLERSGLFLGNVSRSDPHNAKGNHELAQIVRTHNRILRANGGSWRKPPQIIEVGWWHRRALERIAVRLDRGAPCGFKDPRTLVVLGAWLNVLEQPALIGTFRHPAAVARSLARRNGMAREEAYALWLRYNTDLVKAHRQHCFPIVEFDLADADRYCSTVARAAAMIGLEPELDSLRAFVERELCHFVETEERVPETCEATYGYLRTQRARPST